MTGLLSREQYILFLNSRSLTAHSQSQSCPLMMNIGKKSGKRRGSTSVEMALFCRGLHARSSRPEAEYEPGDWIALLIMSCSTAAVLCAAL